MEWIKKENVKEQKKKNLKQFEDYTDEEYQNSFADVCSNLVKVYQKDYDSKRI